jgi:hypothetical protein
LKSLDSRCSLPLSVVIEGGNDVCNQIQGFCDAISFRAQKPMRYGGLHSTRRQSPGKMTATLVLFHPFRLC